MLKQKEGVSQFRTSDKQRGVEFDSVTTQKKLLAFVKAVDEREYRQITGILPENPGLRHFIEVIANGGVIPQNNPKFEAMLKRKGILASDIPNTLRAYYLRHFSESTSVEITYWGEIPLNKRQDFIIYLKKVVQLKNEMSSLALENQKKIRELIIPILKNNSTWISEDIDNVRILAQRWSMTNHQLAEMVNKLWERMTAQLSAETASRIVGRSAGTMRRWAREDKIHVEIDNKGHWAFTREILIDHINKTPKGVSMRHYDVICLVWTTTTYEYMPGSDLTIPDGFSLHESEEDCQTFVNTKPREKGSYPQGKPYEIQIDHMQYMTLRNEACRKQCGLRIYGDHPELKKTA